MQGEVNNLNINYEVLGEGKPIILGCFCKSKKEKRLYNSDKLWNYVVYEAEAFLGALDRGSLGKSTSVGEETVDVSVPLRLM